MKNSLLFLVIVLSLWSCKTQKMLLSDHKSETLEIKQLSDKVFVHISQLDIPDYGKFPCNGMILADGGEAIVFDTPTDDAVANELIDWLENTKKHKVKAVVVNHFHVDCLGGLAAFHQRGIPSYASTLTAKLAREDEATLPQNTFEKSLELKAGKTKVVNKSFGQGHSHDNIVSYVADEETLFGGCMIKSLRARKGNLADANVAEWANTVRKIKVAYPNLKHVIPGHGAYGNINLLDYTIALFDQN